MFLGRVVGPGDPVWLDEDRAYVLAWQAHRRDTCTGCGHSLTTSTAKENQLGYDAEVVRCHACAAQQRTLTKFADDGGERPGCYSG